jgi:hypothetical protein
MNYIQVTNWKDKQQYKDRDPKWIKVYRELLDDYQYNHIPDADKSHVIGIWLLAAKLDNKIPADANWIKNRINATKPINLQLLTESGFIEMYNGKQNTVQSCTELYLETETEKSREREETETDINTLIAIMDYWNSKKNLPKVRTLTPKRKSQIRSRLKEGEFNWQKVIDKISASEFCTGSDGWKASFDWFVKNQDNYIKVLEGNYDSETGSEKDCIDCSAPYAEGHKFTQNPRTNIKEYKCKECRKAEK